MKYPSVPISRTDRVSDESGSFPEKSSGQPLSAGALSWEFELAETEAHLSPANAQLYAVYITLSPTKSMGYCAKTNKKPVVIL